MKYLTPPNYDKESCLFPLKESTNHSRHSKSIRKRNRKSINQLEILSQEFQLCTEWSKPQICRIMKKTGLSEAQIYKWGWDQKKKIISQEKIHAHIRVNLNELFEELPEANYSPKEAKPAPWGTFSCNEALTPAPLDFHFYRLQKSYKELSDELKQDSSYNRDASAALYINFNFTN
jgi:hypothetical protein